MTTIWCTRHGPLSLESVNEPSNRRSWVHTAVWFATGCHILADRDADTFGVAIEVSLTGPWAPGAPLHPASAHPGNEYCKGHRRKPALDGGGLGVASDEMVTAMVLLEYYLRRRPLNYPDLNRQPFHNQHDL